MLRAPLAAALLVLLAGCAAEGGEDPFAYMRKPLYAGGFDLARLGDNAQTQEFRVTDGSIGQIRVQVWINATSGGASVTLRDPSGDLRMATDTTKEQRFPLDLGRWTVEVDGQAGSSGLVHVLATRG